MRFLKTLPVFALALGLALGACQQEGVEEGEELTPADTAAVEEAPPMEEEAAPQPCAPQPCAPQPCAPQPCAPNPCGPGGGGM